MLRIASIAVLLFATPLPAFADRTDADACAQKLSGLALQTYHASIVRAERGQTLRQAISAHLKPLVEAAKISEDDAQKSGFSAAMCVRLVHRK